MKMADSAPSHGSCCKIKTTNCPCPVCGSAGRKVTPRTLDHHLPEVSRAEIGDDAAFCLNPLCDVVYCNPRGFIVKRGETVFPVTIKDGGDEVPVCYCFDIRRADIRKELSKRGQTDFPERIKQGIADGRCDCERMNPQGACCLGNAAAEIKQLARQSVSKADGLNRPSFWKP